MRLPFFDFSEPATLSELFAIMERYGERVRPLAGGTDLIPQIRFGLLQPAQLVSLKNLRELKGIKREGKAIHIGSITTLSELAASQTIKKNSPALYEAALAVAAPPIRNVATIGGNVFQNSRCLFYNQSSTWRLERPPCLKAGGKACLAVPGSKKCFSVYQGDIAPALIAIGARVRIEGKRRKTRELPVEELFTRQGLEPIRILPGEIATQFVVPIPQKATSSYQKFRLRSAVDYPLAGVAASVAVKRRKIETVRLVLSASGPAPVIVPLQGISIGETVTEVDLEVVGRAIPKNLPLVNNLTLPASYRREMFSVFAKRAIKTALERV
jgi:4-hydroxybenzoyl-CoA reductase subunit beta